MFIKELTLHNFRNYEHQTIQFDEGINILYGANAQGKTNVAEGVFFLCTGYSPRASRDVQLIKKDCKEGYVKGQAVGMYGSVSVQIDLNKNDKKIIKVNEMPIKRLGELMGNINAVFFNPGELKLVQESPEDRRRFLNISLSEQSKAYFYALQRYNKILVQRNNLLKEHDADMVLDTLNLWDTQMATVGAKIIKDRLAFLKQLSPYASEYQSLISENKEILTLDCESGYSGDENEIATAFLNDLERFRERDLRLGFTTVGPHRDDIKIHLNNEDVKIYGSQGQHRTIALSLKLAEVNVFKDKFGENPILILDDVLSELDKRRQKKLIGLLDGIQTLITCTNIDGTVYGKRPLTRIQIAGGKVKNITKK